MDDATIQEVVNLDTALVPIPLAERQIGPFPFNESSGKVLPAANTFLQQEVDNIKAISDEREMVLNAKKTFIFIANFTKDHQFKPLLKIPGERYTMQVVQKTKLLGIEARCRPDPTAHC